MYLHLMVDMHLPLMQSNVQLLEDVPPGRQCTVVSHLPGGKKKFHSETLQKSRKLWSGEWGSPFEHVVYSAATVVCIYS